MIPSDFWRLNCFASFTEDPTLSRDALDRIGVKNLCWGSDYPHPETTYPRSRETLEGLFAGIADVDLQRMCYGNAKELFAFNG
jgi:predicted TIM-barrel fold metal-dependent hydrolase